MRDPLSQVGRFCEHFKRRFAHEFDKDPAGFKRRVMRGISKALSLKRGRRPESNISLAANLLAQGKEWREIYPLCIESHQSLGRDSRRIAEENLRAAVRSRRNARRRRMLRSV